MLYIEFNGKIIIWEEVINTQTDKHVDTGLNNRIMTFYFSIFYWKQNKRTHNKIIEGKIYFVKRLSMEEIPRE